MRKLTPWGKSKGAELEPTEKKKKKIGVEFAA